MISQLQSALKITLPKAKKIYVATALINRYGYNFFFDQLNPNTEVYFLIGINLPSEKGVLNDLYLQKGGRTHTRLYAKAAYFHPKLYIIEDENGEMEAYVGSANTTRGGLLDNVEMTIAVTDSLQTAQLLSWFMDEFSQASEITKEFLEKYHKISKEMARRASSDRSDTESLKRLLNPPHAPPSAVASREQFFNSSHYQAYAPENEYDYSAAADQRRKEVRSAFDLLRKRIYPRFKEFGLESLHPHSHAPSRISHYQYRQGFNNAKLKSMWLHYGYSKGEYRDDFGSHPRIQIILHHKSVGIWLMIGKPGGSWQERKNFKSKIQADTNFKEFLHQTLLDLGNGYDIFVSDRRKNIADFDDSRQLSDYLSSDEENKYYTIQRNYEVSDQQLSDANIAETILLELSRLNPLYKIFKALK